MTRRAALLAVVLLLSFAAGADASTCTFNEPLGSWSSASSWACGAPSNDAHVPTTGDLAVIPSGSHVAIDGDYDAPDVTNAGTLSIPQSHILTVNGTLTLDGGVIQGSGSSGAQLIATNMEATSGALNGLVRYQVSGTFTKTTAGVLSVGTFSNVRLKGASTLAAGSICVNPESMPHPFQETSLSIEGAFAIGAGAAATPFACAGVVHVRSPGGSLTSQRASVQLVPTFDVSGVALTVPAGQTWDFTDLRVNGAMLTVEGSLGSTGTTTLAFSATLAGTGHLANVANAGGVVRPAGSALGALTVDGSYTQGAGGTLAVQINGPADGAHDLLDVGGPAAIAGALKVEQGLAYTPAVGDQIRVVESATQATGQPSLLVPELAGGARYAYSRPAVAPFGALLTIAAPAAPVAVAQPAVTGAAKVGEPLTCQPGEWTPVDFVAFAYSWLRDGVPVATGPAYTVQGADAGHQVVCRVVGSNAGGSAQADTAPLSIPAPVVPIPTPTPVPVPAAEPGPAPVPPAPTPEQLLKGTTASRIATAFGLPAAKSCVNKRSLAVSVRAPRGVAIAKVKITANGRALKVRRSGRRYTAKVALAARKAVVVRLTVTTASGLELVGARTYRRCASLR